MVPPSDRPFDFTIDIYGNKYIGNTGDFVDARILYNGAFEKAHLFFIKDCLQAFPESTFLDIGANTGQHSMFASKYAREVHAIEPYEPVLARFRKMIALNNISNITIHPVGFGRENAELPFEEPPANNLGMGSFVLDNDMNRARRTLKIVKGDDELLQSDVRDISIVKIDVEGFEKPVLEGLKKTLERDRPIVVFEVTPRKGESFNSAEELKSVFPKDYELYSFWELSPYVPNYQIASLRYYDFKGTKQGELVAIPLEKKEKISFSFKQ